MIEVGRDITVDQVMVGSLIPGTLTVYLDASKSVLIIQDSLKIESRRPIPNWWRRFWYWALLGWRWERR